MKEILLVFRKDVRRLAAPLLVVLALQAMFAFAELRLYSVDASRNSSNSLLVILPFTWIFLIAAAVLQEKLPGTRQYWLTRPISWDKLLAAKLLFVLVFVNLAMFLSDCAILQSLHLAIVPLDLFLRQIPLTVLLFLPAFCIASLSSGLGQFALGLVLAALGFVIVTLLPALLFQEGRHGGVTSIAVSRFASDWLFLLLPLLTLLIITFQFARRATVTARLLFVIPLFWLIPLTFWSSLDRNFLSTRQPEVREPANRLPELQIIADLDSSRRPDAVSQDGFTGLQLPIQIVGLPPGAYIEGSGIDANRAFVSIYADRAGYWLRFRTEGTPKETTDETVGIAIQIFKVTRTQTIPLGRRVAFSPVRSVNCLSAWPTNEFNCWSGPLREHQIYRAFVSFDRAVVTLNDSHLEGLFAGGLATGLSPIDSWKLSIPNVASPNPQRVLTPDRQVQFLSLEPAANLERNFEIHHKDLSNYVVRP